MINVLYTHIDEKLDEHCYQYFLNQLPQGLQDRNKEFIGRKDKLTNLFGKLLLKKALAEFGFEKDCLEKMKYTEHSRPYITDEFDFNISHSGNMVCCAIGRNIRLGIDIQEILDKDLTVFNNTMSNEQWETIYKSKNPLRKFYYYWTIKESVIKAEGTGLLIPLNKIIVKQNIVKQDKNRWFVKELFLDENYISHIAINRPELSIEVLEYNFQC